MQYEWISNDVISNCEGLNFYSRMMSHGIHEVVSTYHNLCMMSVLFYFKLYKCYSTGQQWSTKHDIKMFIELTKMASLPMLNQGNFFKDCGWRLEQNETVNILKAGLSNQMMSRRCTITLHMAAFSEQRRSLFHQYDHLISLMFYSRDNYSNWFFWHSGRRNMNEDWIRLFQNVRVSNFERRAWFCSFLFHVSGIESYSCRHCRGPHSVNGY